MATIKLNHTKPSEEIEISIGVLGMNLATREANVRLVVTGIPRKDVQVDMLPAYNSLDTDEKTLIKNWYRQMVALGMNVGFETSLVYTDIPDTIFSNKRYY